MQVIKSSGEKQDFKPGKIRSSILEAGGSKKLADDAGNYKDDSASYGCFYKC